MMASRNTGLTEHLISIWGKRCPGVKLEQTGTNRRLYLDEQIKRECLLHDITRDEVRYRPCVGEHTGYR